MLRNSRLKKKTRGYTYTAYTHTKAMLPCAVQKKTNISTNHVQRIIWAERRNIIIFIIQKGKKISFNIICISKQDEKMLSLSFSELKY